MSWLAPFAFFCDPLQDMLTPFVESKDTHPEVGKVTLKSNGDEALRDESILKATGMKR
jgi:hypothetical protein